MVDGLQGCGAVAGVFIRPTPNRLPRPRPQFMRPVWGGGEEGRVYAAFARDALIATERHIELLDALILPATMVDMGFEYLEEGEKPYDVNDHDDVILINEDLV
ncbi:MAG UNVERIFIED_CONTAM: hypothetical protein LVT10_02260 [Anaerolineae bacterium]